MRNPHRSRAALLTVAVAVLCLVGQVAAVAPAGADQAPTETRGSGTLTRGESPVVLTGTEPAGVQPQAKLTATSGSLGEAAVQDRAAVEQTLPAPDRGWTAIMTEGFEGIFPSGAWTAWDDNGTANGDYCWDDESWLPTGVHTGSWSAWPAGGCANGVDPNSYFYPPDMASWMTYGPFDLSGASAAKLEFWYWNQSEPNYDKFWWFASADETTYTGSWVSGDSPGWVFQSFDLAAYLGDSSVWIGFKFESNGTNQDDGPFVDDVVLSTQSGVTPPPGAFNKTTPANGATGQPLSPALSWSGATGAASYEYCYDTSNDNACGTWTSTGTATSANLAGLAASTTYYWQVRASNGAGTTYADGASTAYWSFTTTSAPAARDWTYMVYLDGDNNLEAAAVDDFLELSSVGSTSRVAVVAQMDRITGWDTTYDNWTDTRRFTITAGMTPSAANGTSIGEVNMGDPNTLVGFVQWAMTNFPADRYALILWDHGSGWRSRALTDPLTQGIAYDDSSGGDGLSMVELRSALSTLTGGGTNPFDLIGMDACLMAMIEVDNQLRPYADVRVTSQEVEPNDGAPQDAIVAALVGNPTMTTEALATIYVDEYYASYGNGQTQSAADLGADYTALNTAVNNFAAALLANGAANAAGIQAARSAVQDFDFDYYIDLYDFASRVSTNVANTAIDNAAAAVMAAMGPATIRERHGASWPGAHGLSIYFPKTLGEYDTRYDGSSGFLQFTAATQWDEWLRAYYGYGSGPASSDDFDSPILIGGSPYTSTQDVSPATTAGDDPALPCAGGEPRYRTVWYRYTAPTAQTLTIDTFGSDYDTVLGVWTGSRSALTNVGCNDDAGNVQSRVQVDAPAGTALHIEIASFVASPAGSQLILNLSAVAVALPGAFGKTSPTSGAMNLEQPVTLSWSESPGATSYEYCHDASNDGACTGWVSTGTSTSRVVTPTPGISYWQVRARNAAGLTYANGGPTSYWSFEASSIGFWALLAPMGAARPGAAVAAAGGKVYAIGGSGGLTEVKAYNPATSTWTTRSAKPTGVSDAGAAVINGLIYVAGGNNGTTPVATLEAYDPAANTWTVRAPLPVALQGAAVVAVGSKLYVIGGYSGSTYLSSCYAYDQPTNTWATCTSLPGAPAYSAAGAVDGKIYLWGGQIRAFPNSTQSTSPYSGFVQRYDPATASWAAVVSSVTPSFELAYGAAAVYDGRLYRCGGQTHTATSIPGPVPLWVHQYETTSTCSTYEPGVGIDYGSFPHMQEARRGHGLVESGGRLYAVGGYAASIESALLPGAPPPAILEMSFRSQGAYDGWVLEENEASGRGGTLDAAETTARVGDDASDRQWRSILHFDTSGLPDGAVITGVTLKVKRQAIVGGNPFDSLGYLTVDQKTGAYHDNPALEKLDFHAVGSRGNVGRFIKTPSSGWYRAPLRSPSYALVNLTGSTQFRLRFFTDDNDNGVADYLSFYTGNAPEADRPMLIVTYYVP